MDRSVDDSVTLGFRLNLILSSFYRTWFYCIDSFELFLCHYSRFGFVVHDSLGLSALFDLTRLLGKLGHRQTQPVFVSLCQASQSSRLVITIVVVIFIVKVSVGASGTTTTHGMQSNRTRLESHGRRWRIMGKGKSAGGVPWHHKRVSHGG